MSTKITDLTELTVGNVAASDVLPIDDVSAAATKKVQVGSILSMVQNGQISYAVDAGSNDTYAVTLAPAVTAYTTGMVVRFKANTANTGACSLALNGLSAITIKKNRTGVTTDLDNNDILAGQFVQVIYDGTNFQLLSPDWREVCSQWAAFAASPSNSVANYIAPFTGTIGATETLEQIQVTRAGTFKNLYIRVTRATANNSSVYTTTVRKNGADTALTCSAGPANAGAAVGSDTTNSFTVVAGDLISVKTTSNAGGNIVDSLSFTMDFVIA